jgi:UDP-glucose 4-epimerase
VRVIVTGATSNIGGSVVEALAERDEVAEIVGLARQTPTWSAEKTSWVNAGVVHSDLEPIFDGADVVLHLAWAIQPSHDFEKLERINVEGSRRVFDAVAAAGVPKLIYGSSVGAYSPAPKDQLINEDWPLGTEASFHARHKAVNEAQLDEFESAAPNTRVVRLRPALTFKGDATTELRRLIVGPFIPDFLLRSRLIPAIPRLSGLCFQAIHISDLARAYMLATIRDVSGAFNLASNPPLDIDDLAAALGTGTFPLPFSLSRRLAGLSWHLRLQPTPPDWLDTAMRLPLMSSERAGLELGWDPQVTAIEALADLFTGLRSDGDRPWTPLGSIAPAMRFSASRSEIDSEQTKQPPVEGKLLRHLVDAHSISKQALVQMGRAPAIGTDERLAEIFEAHRDRAEEQERRLRERLEAHGGVPEGPANGAGGIGLAVFAASQPDTPGKLIAHAFSYAQIETAAYAQLQRTAEAAGDGATAATARQIGEEARRMADRLEGSFDLAVDASPNGAGEENLSAQLDRCLADLQVVEKQGLQLLEMALKVAEEEDLKRFLATRLRESEEHAEMLRERLEVRGVESTQGKDAPLRIGGMQVGAFLAAQPDTTARLIALVSAYQHLEIAAYELLARLARRAGDRKVTGVAERILAEERVAVADLDQAAAGS